MKGRNVIHRRQKVQVEFALVIDFRKFRIKQKWSIHTKIDLFSLSTRNLQLTVQSAILNIRQAAQGKYYQNANFGLYMYL